MMRRWKYLLEGKQRAPLLSGYFHANEPLATGSSLAYSRAGRTWTAALMHSIPQAG